MWVNLISLEEKETIWGTENKTGLSLDTSCLCLRHRSTDDPSLSSLLSSIHFSCIVFSPSRFAAKNLVCASLSRSSLRITLNIPLCFLRNFRSPAGSHAASSNTFRGKGAGDRDREMGDCREERLRNILERRRSCSSRGELLSRTISDEKIRIINAERAREVRQRYIVPGVLKLLVRLKSLR